MGITVMRYEMEQELVKINDELTKVQGTIATYSEQRDELIKQSLALQSALKILGDREPAKADPWSSLHIPAIEKIPYHTDECHVETVDGVQYVIEAGFELSKNSFGEISIVPVGAKAIPMPEPLKPATLSTLLPPVETGEGFESVEDLI